MENEGLVCDLIVTHLERRSGTTRSGLSCPERTSNVGGVELLFSLGCRHYALEHTRVEPYPDQIRFDTQFLKFIQPLEDELQGSFPRPGVYTLLFPLEVNFCVRPEELDFFRSSLKTWVFGAAQRLHARNPIRLDRWTCPRGISDSESGTPEGFNFEVSLRREMHWSESGRHDGVFFPARIGPVDGEYKRRVRLQTAFDKKKTKLSFWKNQGRETILVLENQDWILTNYALVGSQIQVLLPEQPFWLDKLYMVDTSTQEWTLYEWSWSDQWWKEEHHYFKKDTLADVLDHGCRTGNTAV